MILPQQQNSTRRITRLAPLIGVFTALLGFWYLLPLRSVVPIPTCSFAARPHPGSYANLTHTPPRPHHILPDPPKRESSWLLATIIGAQNQQRRNIIRATWQRLFASPDYDFRFIIADLDDDIWTPVLQAENDTYGDLIQLDGLPEDRYTANTIKTMEFITALTTGRLNGIPKGKRYDWVSKVDDDTFLDPNAFHAEFLAQEPVEEKTLVGMLYEGWQSGRNYSYPSGRFYTLSWPLATTLGALYVAHPIVNEHEDALIGRILYEGHQEYNFIGFPYERSPEIGQGGGYDASINATTYIMHGLKQSEQYLQVASLFDSKGYNGKLLSGITRPDVSGDEEDSGSSGAVEEEARKEAEERKKAEEELEQEKKKAETEQLAKETSKQDKGGEQDRQGSGASQEQELRDSQRGSRR